MDVPTAIGVLGGGAPILLRWILRFFSEDANIYTLTLNKLTQTVYPSPVVKNQAKISRQIIHIYIDKKHSHRKNCTIQNSPDIIN